MVCLALGDDGFIYVWILGLFERLAFGWIYGFGILE